jgi:WD40 repeat protein
VWVQQVGCGVQALTFARDGRTLYTLDTQGRLIAWDTSTRAKREIGVGRQSRDINAEHFFELPNGRLLLDTPSACELVDPVTGAFKLAILLGRRGGARDVTVLPDGYAFFIHVSGRAIGRTNLLTGEELPLLDVPGVEVSRRVVAVSVALDRRSAFVNAPSLGKHILFDITPDHRLVKREPDVVVSAPQMLRFALDGRTAVLLGIYDRQLTVWDIERREARAKPVWWAGGEVRIAFNPVLPLFAVPHTQNTVAIRSLETGELVRELDFVLGKQITALAFAPDGLTCAVGGTNKRFAVFDVDV